MLVLLSLADKAEKAFHYHQDFHHEMIKAAMAQFDEKETQILLESLGGLADYFSEQKKTASLEGRDGREK